MDTYFAAKARLFTDILMHAGVAVINIDDPYGRKLAEMIAADAATPRVLVTLGFAKDADFRIIKIEPVAGLLQQAGGWGWFFCVLFFFFSLCVSLSVCLSLSVRVCARLCVRVSPCDCVCPRARP